MMRTWVVVAVIALMGCEGSEVKSEAMRLSWKPPRGVSLLEETPQVLRFSKGVEIHAVTAPPPELDEGKLDALLSTVLGAAGMTPLPTRISGRLGSIPAGPVARWVLAGGGGRALHYYLPNKGRYLVISMTLPEGEFGTAENQLDLAMSTLKLE